MPRPMDIHTRTDDLTLAAWRLIQRGGMQAVTMRGLAREAGISVGALTDHFGRKARFLGVAARTTGVWHLKRAEGWQGERGVHAYLPDGPHERADARVWLSWVELALSDESVARAVDEVLVREEDMIAALLGCRWDQEPAATLIALVRGLRAAMCAPVRPLSVAEAHRTLGHQLRLIGAPESALDRTPTRHRVWGTGDDDQLTQPDASAAASSAM